MKNRIYFGDNIKFLQEIDRNSVNLIYIKPPFGYLDAFEEYRNFLEPRLKEAYLCLTSNGSLYFHINYEVVHYIKTLILDEIFLSRDCFLNEIIWTYDTHEQSESRWAPKHDTILVYAKDPSDYTFNVDDIDRIRYLAPSLVGEEKERLGKLPTDTWWYTNVEGNGKDEASSSTLPLQMIKRIILASSNPGDTVLDFFARDGKVGEACLELDKKRDFILIDKSKRALNMMAKKFKDVDSIEWINFNPYH